MRIGIIGDVHLPYEHPLYLRFCMDVFDQWAVDHIHLVGDVVDCYTISRHGFDPNGPSPGGEIRQAIEQIQPWIEAFPVATACIGNHDERIDRRAAEAAMPGQFIRTLHEVLGTASWAWDFKHILDGVLCVHGTLTSGKDAAFNRAIKERRSVAMGHVHSCGGVKYHTSSNSRIFGLASGCGVDIESLGMVYGRPFPDRPVLGCGIILDGQHAYFEAMPCGPKEAYHKSRA